MTLLTKREFVFDARANAVESVPLPAFGTATYGTWILSVAVASKTSVLTTNLLKVWVQNVVVDEDNPSVVFAGDGPSVGISFAPPAPHLATSSQLMTLGPQARLMLQWSQGTSAFSPPTLPVARIVLSAYLTLRPAVMPTPT